MRDEAAERYERGESSSSTLHSCLQKTHKGWTDRHPDWWSDSHWSWHGQWTTSWSSGYDWAEGAQAERQHLRRSGASPSSARPSSDQPPVDEPDSHTDRPLPPTPPTPPKEDGASHGGSAKGETTKVMAAVKSKPRTTQKIAVKGPFRGPMQPPQVLLAGRVAKRARQAMQWQASLNLDRWHRRPWGGPTNRT